MFANRWLLSATLVCIALQLAAVEIPFLQRVLDTVGLNVQDWGLVVSLSLAPVAVVELVKLVQRRLSRARTE